jgi:Superinfection immunity protein/Protein of unknown function (DUF2510)
MTDQGGFQGDETAPIAASFPAPTSALPAVVAPAPPVVTTPAGWYQLHGGQRYWDGYRWTEHTAPAPVPVYAPAYHVPMVVTDARTNAVDVTIAWILTVVSVGYMLPWAIAATRGKSNSGAVGLVNFLLGWTFIGWVAALVMACSAHQVAFVHHRG